MTEMRNLDRNLLELIGECQHFNDAFIKNKAMILCSDYISIQVQEYANQV